MPYVFPISIHSTSNTSKEDLAQARSHIEDLEEQNATLKEQYESKVTEVSKLKAEEEERSKELSTLRNRLNLSTQNWAKEREDLVQREAYAKEEFESAKQAMQDWEILAMEERTIRESLTEKTAELEEQLVTHRDELQRFESERDSQSLTIDGLQRALQELQDGAFNLAFLITSTNIPQLERGN